MSWRLPPLRRTVCIIGDSNLRSFSSSSKDDLQIECFPGMRLASLHKVLTHFVSPLSGPFPKAVIFSVGVNDRQYAKSTTKVNLDKVMSAAQKAFPKSQIYFSALNNYNVSSFEQANLRHFNKILQDKYQKRELTPIPDQQFKTKPDGIHWTPDTAKHILEHWLQQVN